MLLFWAFVAWRLPFPLLALCVVLEHALKHFFATCWPFAIILAGAQAISPCFHSLFMLFRCVWWISADLAEQWRQNRGGVSEVGKNDCSILLFVFCVVFIVCLLISLARARPCLYEIFFLLLAFFCSCSACENMSTNHSTSLKRLQKTSRQHSELQSQRSASQGLPGPAD